MKYQKIILWVSLITLSVFGLITKLVYTLNRSLDSDDVLPAMYFYDIIVDKNYFLNNWHVGLDPYFFTDLIFYLITGLAFGLNLLSFKFVVFFVYFFSISILFILIFKNWGIIPAFISFVVMSATSPFSTLVLARPYHHIATITFSIILLLTINAIVRSEKECSPKHFNRIYYYFILFIISAVIVFSDVLFIFIFTIPVVATFILLNFIKVKIASNRKQISIIIILLSGAFLGLLLQREAALLGLHFIGTINHPLASFPKLIKNIYLYWQCFMALFDFNIFDGDLHLDIFLIKLLKGLFVIIVTVSSIFSLRRETDSLRKFIILFFLVQAVLLSSAFIFGTRAAHHIYSARYLMPLLYSFSFFAGLLLKKIYISRFKLFGIFFLFLFLPVAVHNSYDAFNKAKTFNQEQFELAKYLESEKLFYGYSNNYWTSNIITFLTNNKVRVRSVNYSGDEFIPPVVPTNLDWFDPAYYNGQTFLMIPRPTYPGPDFLIILKSIKKISKDATDPSSRLLVSVDQLAAVYDPPARVISVYDMDIYVWNYNIMEKQFLQAKQIEKSIQTKQPLQIEITDKTPHQIGIIETLNAKNILHATKGQRGFLVFGPYWPLKEGEYTVKFVMQVTGDANQEIATIDVNVMDLHAHTAVKPIEEKIISTGKAEWKEYTFNFYARKSLSNTFLYEFRVFATGKGDVKVKEIEMKKL